MIGDKTAHCEEQYATQNKDARAYCMKEDTRIEGPFELGEFVEGNMTQEVRLLQALQRKEPVNWSFLEEHASVMARRFSWARAVIENGPNCVVPHYNTPSGEESSRPPPEVWYVYGDTGIGKTRWVYQREPEVYEIPEANSNAQWYDGYAGREAVLFDEFVGQVPVRVLNKLLDPYFRRNPVKGGFTCWRPLRIYFTSNYTPPECFPKSVANRRPTVVAWLRRITHFIHATEDSFEEDPLWPTMTPSERMEKFGY